MMVRDRVALVAGGGGGIGRKVVSALAGAGATVVVAGRSSELAGEAERSFARFGDRLAYHQLDVLDFAACNGLVEAILRVHGGLDYVVDCTNIETAGMSGPFRGVDAGRFAELLNASITPVFNLCHAALPALTARGGGSIVAFASDSGKVAAPNQTMVGSTRAAIMMFVRSLALEVARDAIRVNCVSTSFVKDTPVYDMVMRGELASRARTAEARAGLGLPDGEDLAGLVAFLCSDASAHLTGQVISVNGGVSAA